MPDVVCTVPKGLWDEWIAEGDAASTDGTPAPWEGESEYFFRLGGPVPQIEPGQHVYIVAHGKLRGYAPLVRIDPEWSAFYLVRRGGAVAVTIDEPIRGFRGWRYVWWKPEDEKPFPEWRTP
jgi:hypothetical protein